MSTPKTQNPNYIAQTILSRRDHSEYEIRTKMKRKKFSPKQIDDTIASLKKIQLIDDKKFTTMYIDNTLLFKPVGPRWLRYKLKQKGIDDSMISSALTAAYPSGREAELAQQAAESWQKSHPKHQDDRVRLTRYLTSRGFSYEIINTL